MRPCCAGFPVAAFVRTRPLHGQHGRKGRDGLERSGKASTRTFYVSALENLLGAAPLASICSAVSAAGFNLQSSIGNSFH
jgi:hypothetical protein